MTPCCKSCVPAVSGTLPSKLKPKKSLRKGNCCRISLSRGYPGCREPQSQAALNEPISGCSASALVGWQERSIRWDDESPGCYSDRELKAAGPSPSPSPFAKAKPQARLGRCRRWVLSTQQGLFPRVKSPACMEYEAAGQKDGARGQRQPWRAAPRGRHQTGAYRAVGGMRGHDAVSLRMGTALVPPPSAPGPHVSPGSAGSGKAELVPSL